MNRHLLITLAAMTLALAGCSQPGPANQAPAPSSEGVAEEAWVVTNSTSVGYLDGFATFLQTYGAYSDKYCPEFTFQVPANATLLEVRLEGALLNTTEGSAGQYALLVTTPDGETTQRNRLVDQNQTLQFDAPAQGFWEVRVVPSPVTFRMLWPAYVTLSGQGPSPGTPGLIPAEYCKPSPLPV